LRLFPLDVPSSKTDYVYFSPESPAEDSLLLSYVGALLPSDGWNADVFFLLFFRSFFFCSIWSLPLSAFLCSFMVIYSCVCFLLVFYNILACFSPPVLSNTGFFRFWNLFFFPSPLFSGSVYAPEDPYYPSFLLSRSVVGCAVSARQKVISSFPYFVWRDFSLSSYARAIPLSFPPSCRLLDDCRSGSRASPRRLDTPEAVKPCFFWFLFFFSLCR